MHAAIAGKRVKNKSYKEFPKYLERMFPVIIKTPVIARTFLYKAPIFSRLYSALSLWLMVLRPATKKYILPYLISSPAIIRTAPIIIVAIQFNLGCCVIYLVITLTSLVSFNLSLLNKIGNVVCYFKNFYHIPILIKNRRIGFNKCIYLVA